MESARRAELLHAICEHLPDEDAAFIRTLDPADHFAFIEAYSLAIKREIRLPYPLRRRIYAAVYDAIDLELLRKRPQRD